MASFDQQTRRIEARYRALLALAAGAIFLVSVFVVLGKSGESSNEVATPPVSTTTTPPGIEGFSNISISVTSPDGVSSEKCALLAETPDQLAKGLMGRQDLGGYPAMVFRFAEDSTAAFYTANVPVALSIAWFDSQGKFVSTADMPPCEVAAEQCPLYSAKAAFRFALETLQGQMGGLGISEGSTIELGNAPCG